MIYQTKSEFYWKEGIFNNTGHVLKTINGEQRKLYLSKFYQNSVDRRDLMQIRSGKMMKNSNEGDFFSI